MKVCTHIAGSYCTVFKSKEYYIDVRKDVRWPNVSYVEIVRNGQVILRDSRSNTKAPELIVKYMRDM